MNIATLLKDGAKVLEHIEGARLDVELLLCFVLQKNRAYLLAHPEAEVTKQQEAAYYRLIAKRANYMPVAYLVGEKEFMGLPFYVSPNVLIPRPDTELLVETVMDYLDHTGEQPRVLDIGTGSGAIAVSVAYYHKTAHVTGLDISKEAVNIACKNARKNGVDHRVHFAVCDILKQTPAADMPFHCIASNPPYIEEAVIPTLMRDVRDYEPNIALSGGADGLMFYREIIKKAFPLLQPGGLLAFEIGFNQAESVSGLLQSHGGYQNILIKQDLSGLDRVVTAIKQAG